MAAGPSRWVPSQSKAAATRDGMIPAVAALSLSQRVDVKKAVGTHQGVWVISRTPLSTEGALGPTSGTLRKDVVAAHEYGELLLMDSARQRIPWAIPPAGHPPRHRRRLFSTQLGR